MSPEDASSLYSRLEASSRSKKGLRSLLNIKASVDIILKGSHERNLATVAKICCDRFGGPKYQSICNNIGYRAYIDARFIEARVASISSRTRVIPPMEAEALISVLRSEIKILAEENDRLKKAFRTVAPVSIEALSKSESASSLRDDSVGAQLSRDEQLDIKNFIKMVYDLGFDHAPDGRLISSKGFTVIGKAGMTALRRLAGA